MRAVVFAQPQSGTRFITRSIARTARVGFAIAVRAVVRPETEWVIGTHEPYTEEYRQMFEDAGASVIGVERNVLDHILSLSGHTDNADALLTLASSTMFRSVRDAMRAVPVQRRVSYDALADLTASNHEQEAERLRVLVGLDRPMSLEPVEDTMGNSGAAYFGRPGRWRGVLTDSQARAICAAADEPLPE